MSEIKANVFCAEIARRAPKVEKLAQKVARQPDLLPAVFEGLGADKARVKFGCLKLLRIISENNPKILYPEFNQFIQLFDNDNTILKWGAIIIIGNLATVDSENRIDGILQRYLRPIREKTMITAANVIGAAGKIARAKPYLADRIAQAVLQVEKANYQTPECRNVAIGHAVKAFGLFFPYLKRSGPVVEFVKRQLSNPRTPVKKEAERFLKKYDISPENTALSVASQ